MPFSTWIRVPSWLWDVGVIYDGAAELLVRAGAVAHAARHERKGEFLSVVLA
jgi:hypothetical protein